MTDYALRFRMPHPLRRPSVHDVSGLEAEQIKVFCTAIGARWGNWCRDPLGVDGVTASYIGTIAPGWRLAWSQDNVWQLASHYYEAFLAGTYEMHLPEGREEGRRFQEEAHDPTLYNAVKKLMRLKYGADWIRQHVGPVAKRARLELARHEVAAMAYGRMDTYSPASGEHPAQDNRREYYRRVRAACTSADASETYHPLLYHMMDPVELYDAPNLVLPSPPAAAAPPPTQADAPPEAHAPAQAPPSPRGSPPPPHASPVQPAPAMEAPQAPPQVQGPLDLPPPPPPLTPEALAMAAAAVSALADVFGTPMETDDALACRVCFDKERQLCLHPCHHVPLCAPCYHRLTVKECPICRRPVTGATRVFL